MSTQVRLEFPIESGLRAVLATQIVSVRNLTAAELEPRSREEAIRTLAANAPLALPYDMAAEAIASGQTASGFALAIADYVPAVRAEQEREGEINALVARIASA